MVQGFGKKLVIARKRRGSKVAETLAKGAAKPAAKPATKPATKPAPKAVAQKKWLRLRFHLQADHKKITLKVSSAEELAEAVERFEEDQSSRNRCPGCRNRLWIRNEVQPDSPHQDDCVGKLKCCCKAPVNFIHNTGTWNGYHMCTGALSTSLPPFHST